MHLTPTTQPTLREVQIAVVVTAAILMGRFILQVGTPEAHHSDFTAAYMAATIVSRGEGSKLYDLQEQTRVYDELFQPTSVRIVFDHPPFEALILAPLTKLSYSHAYVLWGIINILVWFAIAFLARPIAPVPHQTFQYLGLCFAFYPLWVAMLAGQTPLLLLLFFLLTYVNFKRKHDFRAGVFLGLALLRFHIVLTFALICLLRQKWRLIAGFASAGLFLAVLSIGVVGPAGIISYVNFTINFVRHPRIVEHPSGAAYLPVLASDMPDLQGLFNVLLRGVVSQGWIFCIVAIVSTSLALFAAWLLRNADQRDKNGFQELAFAATLVIALLLGFHTYVYDMSLMLLAVLLVIGSPQFSEKSRWRTMLVVSIVVIYMPPVYLLLQFWRKLYLLSLVLSAFVMATFGLLQSEPRFKETA